MPDSAHAELVRRFFDAKAADWPAKYAPGGPLAGRLASVGSAVAAEVPPGGRVLDLGCGTGEMAHWLARSGLQVLGCDVAEEMLRGAAAGPGSLASWLRLDPGWQRLPLADGCFDAVAASSVLEYTADPGAVLAECARVLRPGGVLVCTVPDLRHPVRWLEWLGWLPARAIEWPARWTRWQTYQRYLRVSRQRHRHRWWLAAAGRASLRPAPASPAPARPMTARQRPDSRPRPLRLLCLHLDAAGERQC